MGEWIPERILFKKICIPRYRTRSIRPRVTTETNALNPCSSSIYLTLIHIIAGSRYGTNDLDSRLLKDFAYQNVTICCVLIH